MAATAPGTVGAVTPVQMGGGGLPNMPDADEKPPPDDPQPGSEETPEDDGTEVLGAIGFRRDHAANAAAILLVNGLASRAAMVSIAAEKPDERKR